MSEPNIKKKYPNAFPTFNDEQLEQFAKVAECHTYQDGDVLFAAGDRDFKFHVIKSGEIVIVDRSSGEPREMLVHQAGEFTGDLANLTGSSANADAIARGKTEVYEVCAEELRHIISEQPALSDTILSTFIARLLALKDSDYTGLRVIGSRYSADTFRIRDFLTKNRVIFTWLDLETDSEVDALLKQFHVKPSDTPIVAYGSECVMRNPSNIELAERVGISRPIEDALYDLAIVGGGPAGLAAAVYGASEGLKTIVLDKIATGGQAGTSSKIENYLGFPTGVSGAELAGRATIQAEKFGARLSTPSSVNELKFDDGFLTLYLENGEQLRAKSILIASGADYLKLDVENRERFDGAGVYYAATQLEAQTCQGDEVMVVGGGNSAGQAAVFLAGSVRKVYVLIRGNDLNKNMSRYLSQRIEQTENIELLTETEVTKLSGDEHLETAEITNNKTGEKREIKTPAVFSFIGAIPRTDWLPPEIETDKKGFIKTGNDVANSRFWKLKRQPFYLETSRAGIFAAGDVRFNSVKRVASAVGEGSMTVQFVHEYLKEN
ncbi:MAG: FAD-dependent oxidoreductase [Acidobacteriota bacterium]|nr:FAD-dependent oxidoreductase [Acidobacteriota bacterium]